MVYITGDCHGDFSRFNTKNFPDQKTMSRNDYVIICGDFGGIWDNSNSEKWWLKWLSKKNFTVLFCDGNHENFDMLYHNYETVDFLDSKVHKISDNIYHLIRGNIYTIEDKKFFVFGGASSHDISDGILDISNYGSYNDMMADYNKKSRMGKSVRINHISWWKEEMPSGPEFVNGYHNLEACNYKVDYVITHCPPREVCCLLGYFEIDNLIKFFNEILDRGLEFKQWWCGHLHDNIFNIDKKYNLIYDNILRLL